MASASEDSDLKAVRVSAEQTALKDEVYYWLDNTRFLVQGVLFRVPRLPFMLGSRYFTEKHRLRHNTDGAEPIIHLQSVTAAHFRVFLKFLFPMPSNKPIESIFTKLEWITILHLCTVWHFPEFRKLAIQNLDGKLTELELIHFGRALYIPVFVLEGYRAIVDRPKAKIITKEEAAAIGHKSVNKLWTIRYQVQVSGVVCDEKALGRELHESFAEELAELEGYEEEGRINAEDKSEWANVSGEAVDEGEDPSGTASSATAHVEKMKGDGGAAPEPPAGPGGWDITQEDVGQWVASDGEPGSPASHPEQQDMKQSDAGKWGASNGEPQPETEQVRLTRSLENLKEEEQGIVKRIQEVQSWKFTPEAMENLAAVSQARKERMEAELKEIEEAKLAEEGLTKDLEGADETSMPDLWTQLAEAKGRRESLEQHHQDNKGKENGQFIKWKKEGKKGKETELVKLNAELLRCQRKVWEVEGQLKKVDQLDEDSTVDASRGKAEQAADAGETSAEFRKAVDGQVRPPAGREGGVGSDDQRSDRLRVLEEEERRVQQMKRTQVEREAKLKVQEARYSRKLAIAERLLRQPGSSLPKTIQKTERRKVASTKKLHATRTELVEVNQLLEMVQGEQDRLENEKRLL